MKTYFVSLLFGCLSLMSCDKIQEVPNVCAVEIYGSSYEIDAATYHSGLHGLYGEHFVSIYLNFAQNGEYTGDGIVIEMLLDDIGKRIDFTPDSPYWTFYLGNKNVDLYLKSKGETEELTGWLKVDYITSFGAISIQWELLDQQKVVTQGIVKQVFSKLY